MKPKSNSQLMKENKDLKISISILENEKRSLTENNETLVRTNNNNVDNYQNSIAEKNLQIEGLKKTNEKLLNKLSAIANVINI